MHFDLLVSSFLNLCYIVWFHISFLFMPLHDCCPDLYSLLQFVCQAKFSQIRLICAASDQKYDIRNINKIQDSMLQSVIMSFLFSFVKCQSRTFLKQRANGKHIAESSYFLIAFVCTHHIYHCKSVPAELKC